MRLTLLTIQKVICSIAWPEQRIALAVLAGGPTEPLKTIKLPVFAMKRAIRIQLVIKTVADVAPIGKTVLLK
jgi:hypothetical protein